MNKPENVTYEGANPPPFFILLVTSVLLTYVGYVFISSLITPTGQYPEASMAFFGFLFVVIFLLWANTLQLFLKKVPSLTLGDDGIHYEKLLQQINTDTIPWQELGTASIRNYHRSQIISVTFADEQSSYIEHLSKSHKGVFGNTVVLFCLTFDGSGKEICSRINQFIESSQQQPYQAEISNLATEDALNA